MKLFVWTLTLVSILTAAASAADIALPAKAVPVYGAPVQAVGCTAQSTDSDGGYLSEYYIRGNGSFVNSSLQPATEVVMEIHYSGAYGDHDVLLDKTGTFAPGQRIDPKRRAWVALLQPEALNTDVDGSREIDIWGTVSATCSVIAAKFADGSVWRATDEPKSPTPTMTAAPMPAKKCVYDPKSNQYTCG